MELFADDGSEAASLIAIFMLSIASAWTIAYVLFVLFSEAFAATVLEIEDDERDADKLLLAPTPRLEAELFSEQDQLERLKMIDTQPLIDKESSRSDGAGMPTPQASTVSSFTTDGGGVSLGVQDAMKSVYRLEGVIAARKASRLKRCCGFGVIIDKLNELAEKAEMIEDGNAAIGSTHRADTSKMNASKRFGAKVKKSVIDTIISLRRCSKWLEQTGPVRCVRAMDTFYNSRAPIVFAFFHIGLYYADIVTDASVMLDLYDNGYLFMGSLSLLFILVQYWATTHAVTHYLKQATTTFPEAALEGGWLTPLTYTYWFLGYSIIGTVILDVLLICEPVLDSVLSLIRVLMLRGNKRVRIRNIPSQAHAKGAEWIVHSLEQTGGDAKLVRGLRWVNVGDTRPEGSTELPESYPRRLLIKALQSKKTQFTRLEFEKLGVELTSEKHFVQVDDFFFQPAELAEGTCLTETIQPVDTSGGGMTMLMSAVNRADVDAVQALLEAKNINLSAVVRGQTVLHFAVKAVQSQWTSRSLSNAAITPADLGSDIQIKFFGEDANDNGHELWLGRDDKFVKRDAQFRHVLARPDASGHVAIDVSDDIYMANVSGHRPEQIECLGPTQDLRGVISFVEVDQNPDAYPSRRVVVDVWEADPTDIGGRYEPTGKQVCFVNPAPASYKILRMLVEYGTSTQLKDLADQTPAELARKIGLPTVVQDILKLPVVHENKPKLHELVVSMSSAEFAQQVIAVGRHPIRELDQTGKLSMTVVEEEPVILSDVTQSKLARQSRS